MKKETKDFLITALIVFACWILSAWMLSKPKNHAPVKAIRAEIEHGTYSDIHQILAPAKIDTMRIDSTRVF